MSALKLIWPYFKKHRWAVALGFVALVICDFTQLIIPKILGQAIDSLGLETTTHFDMLKPVVIILVLAVMVALMRYVWRNLIIGFSRIVERELRNRLYKKLVRLSPEWHMKNVSGDLMALATNDIEAIRMALSAGLISVVDTLVMGCAALGFMLAISPVMTLWAILPLPAITLVTHFVGRKIYRLVLDVQNIFGQLTEVVREQLSGLKVIRAMGLTHLSLNETERSGQVYLKKNVQMAILTGTFFPFLFFMSNLSVTLVLYFGGRETILSRISTGDFVAFINYLAMLTWPLMALGMIWNFLQQGLASLERLKRVYDAEDVMSKLTEAQAPANPIPAIEIKNLTFQYPTRNAPALKELELKLEPSQITALIGPMGSGKSTLSALLIGLYPAPPGTLKISGQFIEDWPLDKLRALFGYVPQDGFLFTGTILENIIFGKPHASEAEALVAAELAGFASDINGFPDGLHTVVGERGHTLSGGQRQRLALARALLIDPPYLILDDPLSAVDAAVEDAVFKKILTRRQGRGVLLISHRLTSLVAVDRILVLENGQLIEDGSPAELQDRDGYFRRVMELGRIAEGEE